MTFFFNEAARIEHLEHVAYYEEQRRGLGARYLAAFDAAMVKICENPERYRVELAPGIVSALLEHFCRRCDDEPVSI